MFHESMIIIALQALEEEAQTRYEPKHKVYIRAVIAMMPRTKKWPSMIFIKF